MAPETALGDGDVTQILPDILLLDGLAPESALGDIIQTIDIIFPLDGIAPEAQIVDLDGPVYIASIAPETELGNVRFTTQPPVELDGVFQETGFGATSLFDIFRPEGVGPESSVGEFRVNLHIPDVGGIPPEASIDAMRLITDRVPDVGNILPEAVFGDPVVTAFFRADGVGSEEQFGAFRFVYEPIAKPTDNIVFKLILTGSENGVSDLDLSNRMSSFSSRRRSRSPSSLELTLEGAEDIAQDLLLRLDGQLVISIGLKSVTGTMVGEAEISRVNLDSISTTYGAKNSSTQLSGFQTILYDNSATVMLKYVSSKSESSRGKQLQSPAIAWSLQPGDTVVFDGDSFIANRISYGVTDKSTTMSVAESA